MGSADEDLETGSQINNQTEAIRRRETYPGGVSSGLTHCEPVASSMVTSGVSALGRIVDSFESEEGSAVDELEDGCSQYLFYGLRRGCLRVDIHIAAIVLRLLNNFDVVRSTLLFGHISVFWLRDIPILLAPHILFGTQGRHRRRWTKWFLSRNVFIHGYGGHHGGRRGRGVFGRR